MNIRKISLDVKERYRLVIVLYHLYKFQKHTSSAIKVHTIYIKTKMKRKTQKLHMIKFVLEGDNVNIWNV